MEFQNPDDPYTVEFKWETDGLHILVTAEALGYDEEIKAECDRIAKMYVDHFTHFANQIRNKDAIIWGDYKGDPADY